MDARAPKGEDSGIDKVIAAVTRFAQSKGSKAAKGDFSRFIAQFFRGSPPDELAGRPADALYGIALAAWDILDSRARGKEKITIKSLDAYISERVKELTGGRQHPTSVSPPNVPDFPIGVK